mmetsp:Transcript_32057/g.54064  ORF Transcript_32057/g.54064 Transcript_32057/m.54064 type:complete len:313 (-) Transcript_32057:157-1095(-)
MKNRLLLSGLASTGALETGFLSYSKLFAPDATTALCTEASCNSVLSGPYSVIPSLNIPLVAVAFAAYSAVAVFSLLPRTPASLNGRVSSSTTHPYDSYVLFLTTAMATFSAYLMTILTFVLHSSCNYCYLSALISASLAGIAWSSKVVPDKTKAFVIATSSMLLTSVSSGFLFYVTTALSTPQSAEASTAIAGQILNQMAADKAVEGKAPPPITTSSSERSMQLAARLSKQDAKMYGAYWCSHCHNQKQELGKQAFKMLEYIECDKEGLNSQTKLCRANKIPGYPTWVINGQNYPGEKTVEELEQLLSKIEN